jgi:hypothetical protein
VDKYDNPYVPDGARYLSELDVCFIGAATYRMYANRVCYAHRNGEPSPYELDILWMTAFITRYGLYEYKVVPFGLYNGPASWHRHMNSLMPEYFDEFVTIYLDGLLIYSADLDEHKQHVRKVLLRLREAGLPVEVDKCEFHI